MELWYVLKERTPTSKKVECIFCKLRLVHRKENIVAHLGCKINNGKMWGVASCQHQGLVVQAMLSRCGSVWPACSNQVLDDYGMARGTM